MTRSDILRQLASQSATLKQRFGMRDLAVFGSVARDEALPGSDLDLLVSFDAPASFDRFMGLKLYLEDALGVRIDLVTANALRPEMRSQIEREAIHVA